MVAKSKYQSLDVDAFNIPLQGTIYQIRNVNWHAQQIASTALAVNIGVYHDLHNKKTWHQLKKNYNSLLWCGFWGEGCGGFDCSLPEKFVSLQMFQFFVSWTLRAALSQILRFTDVHDTILIAFFKTK